LAVALQVVLGGFHARLESLHLLVETGVVLEDVRGIDDGDAVDAGLRRHAAGPRRHRGIPSASGRKTGCGALSDRRKLAAGGGLTERRQYEANAGDKRSGAGDPEEIRFHV